MESFGEGGAFRNAGLPVGGSFPWGSSLNGWEAPYVDSPPNYDEGVFFYIDTLLHGGGGAVFVVGSEEDSSTGWTYQEGHIRLQLDSELPEAEAKRYEEVFRETVSSATG